MQTIKFISSNVHKFEELQSKLAERKIPMQIIHKHYKYVEIQGDTTREIAMQSATTLATVMDGAFILEDSGLFVKALHGFPGPYSSYVFGTVGFQGILNLMREQTDRSAKFYSVIIYVDSNHEFHEFTGEVVGTIANEARGTMGFGFDPIFVPDGYTKTFAELSTAEKNVMSHRARSFNSLLDYFETPSEI